MSVRGRVTSSTLAALAASILIAGQALALTWDTPEPLTSSGDGFEGALHTLGSSTAIAVYTRGPRVLYRRSIDSGMTWAPRVVLSTNGQQPAIDGRADVVDIVWSAGGRVRYVRSMNGGASFGAPMALSATGGCAFAPDVARGPNGRVVVAWMNFCESILRVRVSIDGGASFGPAETLASGGENFGNPLVEAGKGVQYVGYKTDSASLLLRRSTNSGATWGAPQTIANHVVGAASITAVGTHVYIAFARESSGDEWIRYRRSLDKGASWSSATDLSAPGGNNEYIVQIALQGGVLRAAFTRCTSGACTESRIYYRQSSNGTTWTTAELASTGLDIGEFIQGVGFAGRVIILYNVASNFTGDIYVRTGMP